MKALFVSNDLMFGSRVAAAAGSAGVELTTLGSPSAIETCDSFALAILDLSSVSGEPGGLVVALKEKCPGARVVAYAPHVHEAKLSAAREAGCDLTLTRGQFDQRMGELFGQLSAEPSG